MPGFGSIDHPHEMSDWTFIGRGQDGHVLVYLLSRGSHWLFCQPAAHELVSYDFFHSEFEGIYEMGQEFQRKSFGRIAEVVVIPFRIEGTRLTVVK